MIILVYSLAGVGLSITPEPALIHVGDRVVWKLLFFNGRLAQSIKIKCTIYFEKSNPFKGNSNKDFTAYGQSIKYPPASPVSEENGEVIIDAGKASEAGHYKYGIRITNAETEEIISDDDPALIVLP
ncbi:hypothetical protein [Prosthecobacter sp.]|uniref:hypothetical protein n=1 Tax=Prosthecobacter sp. TaxID=1965333 RepID=UPI003784F668